MHSLSDLYMSSYLKERVGHLCLHLKGPRIVQIIMAEHLSIFFFETSDRILYSFYSPQCLD